MLLGIDPLLGPELLGALRAMGHGDTIVLADANFPAQSSAQRVIRMDGVPLERALRAVLGVLPIDDFVPDPIVGMQTVGAPAQVAAALEVAQSVIDCLVPRAPRIARIERFAFYERARSAFVVVATGERAFYGNVILTKGVVPPPSES